MGLRWSINAPDKENHLDNHDEDEEEDDELLMSVGSAPAICTVRGVGGEASIDQEEVCAVSRRAPAIR